MNLTGQEILDAALFAGFEIADVSNKDLLETEFTIMNCPPQGLLDEDGENPIRYQHIIYYSEYPEEGCSGLGEVLNEIIKQTVS